MKNIKKMILLSIIGFSLIGSFVSPVSANAIKPIEATISRDRGVCGDMNKNSTTYKRYCLKDGNASGSNTFKIICQLLAPIALLASMVPLFTSWNAMMHIRA